MPFLSHYPLTSDFTHWLAWGVPFIEDPAYADFRLTGWRLDDDGLHPLLEGVPERRGIEVDHGWPDVALTIELLVRMTRLRSLRFDIDNHLLAPPPSDWAAQIRTTYPDNFTGEMLVPIGWADLMGAMVELLTEEEMLPVFAQIKEKMAGMTFHALHITPASEMVVRAAEALSENICQVCGRPGTSHIERGFLQVLCKAHIPPAV